MLIGLLGFGFWSYYLPTLHPGDDAGEVSVVDVVLKANPRPCGLWLRRIDIFTGSGAREVEADAMSCDHDTHLVSGELEAEGMPELEEEAVVSELKAELYPWFFLASRRLNAPSNRTLCTSRSRGGVPRRSTVSSPRRHRATNLAAPVSD
jgi:hypothetical protein